MIQIHKHKRSDGILWLSFGSCVFSSITLLGCQWLAWHVAPPLVFVVNLQSVKNKAEIRASRFASHSSGTQRALLRTVDIWRLAVARTSTGLWQLQQTQLRAEPCP